MDIAVIGAGFVGTTSGVCFAEAGHNVTIIEKDDRKVERLQNGHLPFHEPGLADMLQRAVSSDRLHFLSAALPKCDVVFLCVGTPSSPDGSADLTALIEAARWLGRTVKDSSKLPIAAIKSTVPPGTWRKVVSAISEAGGHPLDDVEQIVVSNPEFLAEGNAVRDFLYPDRVVIGGSSENAVATVRSLYEPFCRTGKPIFETSNDTAELSKYAANAMLATRISFMNAIAAICSETGADVDDVRTIMGSDHRIGRHFLFPGIGFGGSCFGKDVKALLHFAIGKNIEAARLLDEVLYTNDNAWLDFRNEIGLKMVAGGTIAVWGLSFKPNTDDTRDSPSLKIIDSLRRQGFEQIRVHDPVAK